MVDRDCSLESRERVIVVEIRIRNLRIYYRPGARSFVAGIRISLNAILDSVSQIERTRLGHKVLRRIEGVSISNRPVHFGTVADAFDRDEAESWNPVSQFDCIILNANCLRRILRRSQSDLGSIRQPLRKMNTSHYY